MCCAFLRIFFFSVPLPTHRYIITKPSIVFSGLTSFLFLTIGGKSVPRNPDLLSRSLFKVSSLISHSFHSKSPTRDPLNIHARGTVLVCCSPVTEREVFFTAANSLWPHCNIDTLIRLPLPLKSLSTAKFPLATSYCHFTPRKPFFVRSFFFRCRVLSYQNCVRWRHKQKTN